jgi:5-methylcytosine-specific restriction enzyme A
MGKLKALPDHVSRLPNTLGFVSGDAKATDRKRDSSNSWRAWYKTKRWADLRMAVFVRDSFTSKRSGTLCSGKHPAPNSPVANHVIAHRGDPELFWDINNIETVTKEEHDRLIQREEQAQPTGRWD